ncbi:helix-turn-helix domain-containing protein [Aquipuribacter hungaricus]|uniref:Helix-turn-helix domain-containing protein n=1 Tax=Aquipuribacter hungaricus TaxID=545624 RepID=A0ABV7WFG3_9MICO
MGQAAPALLPALRSVAQARVLTRLLLAPEVTWTVPALAEAADVSQPTASREVRRLKQTGVVTVDGDRNLRSVAVDTNALLYPELAGLVLKAFGPAAVLGPELAAVDGVEAAWVFGSWVRRYLGDPGSSPSDIDLLVVGRPDMDELADAVTRAGSRLGRPVGLSFLAPGEWEDPRDGFVRDVRDDARVPVARVSGP